MKSIKKLWHSAIVEKKSPRQELYKFLRNYRATPHSSTKRTLAELLFNREMKVRLPQLSKKANDPELRSMDAAAKEKQKMHKDAKKTTKPHGITISDTVLLQRQTTKTQSRYDPEPYHVTKVKGSQITAVRDGKTRVRDAQKFKRVRIASPKRYERIREPFTQHEASDTDFGFFFGMEGQSAGSAASTRITRRRTAGSNAGAVPQQAPAEPAAHQEPAISQANELPANRADQDRKYKNKTLRKQQLLRNLRGGAQAGDG